MSSDQKGTDKLIAIALALAIIGFGFLYLKKSGKLDDMRDAVKSLNSP